MKKLLNNHDEPEGIVELDRPEVSLRGFIVIHSTALGPACGGTRFWSYPDPHAALHDAKRLAKGMSYKNALAGLPMGGGKTVIMRPEHDFDRASLFKALGEAIGDLNGRYVTAEDVGTTEDDMANVASRTSHVSGTHLRSDRPSGNPSPWTALGVFRAMEVAAARKFGRGLSGLTVAVQGIGNVGWRLCELLHGAGARLIVSDPRSEITALAVRNFGATIAHGADILAIDCDIFAPCALGGILDRTTIDELRAVLVCGGANNQLGCADDGARLAERNILYAPDYVVNAGGVINVAAEYLGWSNDDVAASVDRIAERLEEVFDLSSSMKIATSDAADKLAMKIIQQRADRP